jgi:hypothetical protein
MKEEDSIQDKETLQQINQQDWRDGSGGENNLPNDSSPNNPPVLPNEDIPKLSEEESSKLEEWRNSKEFQAGLENIKSKSLQDGNQQTVLNETQNLTKPPEKVKKIAQDLQKLLKALIYISFGIKLMKSKSTKH